MRAVGILVSVSLIANRLVDLHTFKVGVKLVCKHERQGCADDRSHLGPVRHDVDGSIPINSYKEGWMKGCLACAGLTVRQLFMLQYWRDVMHCKDKRSRSKPSFAEPPPACVLDLIHADFPAASLSAWRIRW